MRNASRYPNVRYIPRKRDHDDYINLIRVEEIRASPAVPSLQQAYYLMRDNKQQHSTLTLTVTVYMLHARLVRFHVSIIARMLFLLDK